MLSQHDRMADIYEAYEVHLRYGLCSCARPRSGSGATFFRRCSRASVALDAYAIATQATSLFL
jgi:4-diphosphocytidyl-2C-methyl-D-erythritol kinase